MKQKNKRVLGDGLRSRAEIDTEYAGLAMKAGDLLAKIPFWQDVLDKALARMTELLKEPASLAANQTPVPPLECANPRDNQ